VPICEVEPVATVDLASRFGKANCISTSVATTGEAVFLLAHDSQMPLLQGGGSGFRRARAIRSTPLVVMVLNDARARLIELPEFALTYPMVELLPSGEILVVSQCCHLDHGVPEYNAQVFDPEGHLMGEFVLGDGITALQVSPEGWIWAGYYEQSIYGMDGWGFGSGQTPPIGAAGLVSLDMYGDRRWEYQANENHGPINNCELLNVDRGHAWTYADCAPPLLRVDSQGTVQSWDAFFPFTVGFAVYEDRLLFASSYRNDELRLFTAELSESKAQRRNQYRLPLPSGAEHHLKVVGRGPLLHVFTQHQWLTVDVRELR
jgi:hypothetical protein